MMAEAIETMMNLKQIVVLFKYRNGYRAWEGEQRLLEEAKLFTDDCDAVHPHLGSGDNLVQVD